MVSNTFLFVVLYDHFILFMLTFSIQTLTTHDVFLILLKINFRLLL